MKDRRVVKNMRVYYGSTVHYVLRFNVGIVGLVI